MPHWIFPTIASLTPAAPAPEKAGSATRAGQLALCETSDDGVCVDPLAQARLKGMDLDCLVSRSAESHGVGTRAAIYKIVGFDNTEGTTRVKLEDPGSSEVTVLVSIAEFVKEFVRKEAKDYVEEVKAWVEKRPRYNKAALAGLDPDGRGTPLGPDPL